jgi:hypothetical protein
VETSTVRGMTTRRPRIFRSHLPELETPAPSARTDERQLGHRKATHEGGVSHSELDYESYRS